MDFVLGRNEMREWTINREILGLWEHAICEIRAEIKAQDTPSLVYAKELCDKLENSIVSVAQGKKEDAIFIID